MEKMILKKFTHILLLKNDAKLKKKKKWQITTQKRAITQNYFYKKKCSKKIHIQ